MRYLPHGAGCCPPSGRWWITSAKSISEWKRISFGIGFSRGAPPAENIKEKSPCLRTGSHLEYGGEGGIDSLRSPLLGPSMGLAPAGPTQALFKNAPGVFVGAARSRARGLSNWLRQLSNPGRGFSSPPAENIKEKSPYLRTGSHLEYGGEGGD